VTTTTKATTSRRS